MKGKQVWDRNVRRNNMALRAIEVAGLPLEVIDTDRTHPDVMFAISLQRTAMRCSTDLHAQALIDEIIHSWSLERDEVIKQYKEQKRGKV